MFWLFRLHNMMPSDYMSLPFFERLVVRRFLYREICYINEQGGG